MDYVCPVTFEPLRVTGSGLLRADGKLFRFVDSGRTATLIVDFSQNPLPQSVTYYNTPETEASYNNFLQWLMTTFDTSHAAFRRMLASHLDLKQGDKVVITGCGLGDDIEAVLDLVGPEGQIYAQDLSPAMVISAQRIVNSGRGRPNVHFSIGDAAHLPFADDSFDAAFHFGGFNCFDKRKASLATMYRVVRSGGKVVFGDEGVAPWLRQTDYGRAAITNNPLWSSEAPLDILPEKCVDVNVTWVLGNCFYLVDFRVSETGPVMNMDVRHAGRRGGTMRSRHFGQLEGVTPETRTKAIAAAAAAGLSLHDWLEQAVAAAAGG